MKRSKVKAERIWAMNDGQVRERNVICLTQPGSEDLCLLDVQIETPEDWTGLVLATMNAPNGAPVAGSGMPIGFPKNYWRKMESKEFM
jgi:hypothetical protein